MSVDRETQMTITRREILHRVPQRLKLTEQQSWQDIAQLKAGMTYLQRLPEAIPEGQFLVHNSVRPTHPLGSHGFRAWLQAQDEHLEPCDCGWTPELGTHYRVKLKIPCATEPLDPPTSPDSLVEERGFELTVPPPAVRSKAPDPSVVHVESASVPVRS
jgi:hypothetical protein